MATVMTSREKDIAIWEETCIEFINRATSQDELHNVGLEIAESRDLIQATKEETATIHKEYLKRKQQLKVM